MIMMRDIVLRRFVMRNEILRLLFIAVVVGVGVINYRGMGVDSSSTASLDSAASSLRKVISGRIYGVRNSNEITKDDEPQVKINLVDTKELPSKVTLYCTVVDKLGNSISNLARPYNLSDFKYWSNLQEEIQGKSTEIKDFTVEEIHEDDSPGFTTTFVMDYSESMYLDYSFVNNSLRKAVSHLDGSKDNYEIVQFDNRIKKAVSLTNDLSKVDNLRSFEELGGATAFYSAAIYAIDEISNSNKNKVAILFTDGKDNASLFANSSDLIYKARHTNTKIFVIGFIRPGEEYLKSTLDNIAEQCGGEAFFPNDLNQLDNIFATIYRIMKVHYLVSYTPTEDPSKIRNTKIALNLPGFAESITTEKRYFSSPDTQKEDNLIRAANFSNGETTFSETQLEMVEDIAKLMVEDPNKRVKIVGHTDSKGSDAINDRISLKRAKVVAEVLFKYGVRKQQIIKIQGLGKRKLIYPIEETEEQRQANRRVELEMIQ